MLNKFVVFSCTYTENLFTMKNTISVLILFLSLSMFGQNCHSQKQELTNQLSDQEKKEGWVLLFDGTSTKGWRSAAADTLPTSKWVVKDGELIIMDAKDSHGGGDIITKDKYQNFILKVDFKITPGANSGIKYFVTLNPTMGLEYQILDDQLHPDAKLGSHEGSRTIASLYDLIKATNKKPNPVGEWNHAEIIVKGSHVEHWLNGTKVVEYEKGTEEFKKLVSESKYKDYAHFGEALSGYILLQDHGNEVHYRNVKIKN